MSAPEIPPFVQMQQHIESFWVGRSIYAAAYFGLADLLKGGPRTVEEIAAASRTHAPSVRRLLRALASIGIFHEDPDGRFRSTPLATTLESDAPATLRYTALSELGQEHYQAWEEFPHSIATGEMAFVRRFGMEAWPYYREHAEHAANFNRSMTGFSEAVIAGVMEAYDFSGFRKVVDVGGGQGALLAAILTAAPGARGVLFDAAEVVAGASRLAPVADRCEAVAGNFFEAVPEGGDAYVMKWILHDWTDDQCRVILKNCHRAMAAGGKVIAIDMILPPPNQPSFGRWMDLNMLVMTGGRERTEAEFGELFASAGFRLTRTALTPSGFGVLEGERVAP